MEAVGVQFGEEQGTVVMQEDLSAPDRLNGTRTAAVHTLQQNNPPQRN